MGCSGTLRVVSMAGGGAQSMDGKRDEHVATMLPSYSHNQGWNGELWSRSSGTPTSCGQACSGRH